MSTRKLQVGFWIERHVTCEIEVPTSTTVEDANHHLHRSPAWPPQQWLLDAWQRMDEEAEKFGCSVVLDYEPYVSDTKKEEE